MIAQITYEMKFVVNNDRNKCFKRKAEVSLNFCMNKTVHANLLLNYTLKLFYVAFIGLTENTQMVVFFMPDIRNILCMIVCYCFLWGYAFINYRIERTECTFRKCFDNSVYMIILHNTWRNMHFVMDIFYEIKKSHLEEIKSMQTKHWPLFCILFKAFILINVNSEIIVICNETIISLTLYIMYNKDITIKKV